MNAALALLAAIAVRNPFWPIGHEGVREPITADPVVDVPAAASRESDADENQTAASAAAMEQRERAVSARNWAEARKTLRIAGTTVVTDVATGKRRQSMIINGGTYGDGDLISVNCDGRRFTWRVQGLTDGATLRLVRVRARPLDEE